MPVRLIPNQLVKLYKTQDFNTVNKRRTQDYRQYCQLVREEQTTMFQVQLLPDTDNLITNGDFTDNILDWEVAFESWQWASGRLQGEKTTTAGASIFQTVTVTANRSYEINLTAQFGQPSGQFRVLVTDIIGNIYTSKDFFASDLGTNPFDVELFFYATEATILVSFTLVTDIRDLIYIDEVSLLRLSSPSATLETCTGDLVETLTTFAQSGNVAVFAVEWFGKPEGCYRICLEDTEDTEANYLDAALALGTEGGNPIELEQGGYLKWFG